MSRFLTGCHCIRTDSRRFRLQYAHTDSLIGFVCFAIPFPTSPRGYACYERRGPDAPSSFRASSQSPNTESVSEETTSPGSQRNWPPATPAPGPPSRGLAAARSRPRRHSRRRHPSGRNCGSWWPSARRRSTTRSYPRCPPAAPSSRYSQSFQQHGHRLLSRMVTNFILRAILRKNAEFPAQGNSAIKGSAIPLFYIEHDIIYIIILLRRKVYSQKQKFWRNCFSFCNRSMCSHFRNVFCETPSRAAA